MFVQCFLFGAAADLFCPFSVFECYVCKLPVSMVVPVITTLLILSSTLGPLSVLEIQLKNAVRPNASGGDDFSAGTAKMS